MANKRMFSNSVIDTDAFLDMPLSAQALYFHLNMKADDDGFIGSPKRIARNIGASDDDLKLLIMKSFVLTFENGVIVIKHWRMHNTLSSSRYHETNFVDEKSSLLLKDNNAYSFTSGTPMNDSKYIEMSKRQTKDEQKTSADIDIGLDIDIDKDIDKELDKDKVNIYSPAIKEIIDYLNLKTDSHYTTKNKKTNSHIKARIDEEHTVDEFKTVIDNMVAKWGNDPKMAQYLRPETLFGNKFESYLNMKIVGSHQYVKRTDVVDDWV